MESEARGGGAMADACLVEEEEGLNEWKPETTLEIRDCITVRTKCLWRGSMGLKARYTIAWSDQCGREMRCCLLEGDHARPCSKGGEMSTLSKS